MCSSCRRTGERGAPPRKTSLSPAACLLVDSLRHAALARGEESPRRWQLIRRDFTRLCGQGNTHPALAALIRFLVILQGREGAPIRVHRPCCPQVTADELSLVDLVAACQHGDRSRARELAESQFAHAHLGDVIEAAQGVASTMRICGLDMRLDLGASPCRVTASARGDASAWISHAIH